MYVRFMRREDVDQVVHIDREAFPTEWPSTNFARELDNRLAYYIVACDGSPVSLPVPKPAADNHPAGIMEWLRHLFSEKQKKPVEERERIAGYAGMWILADEAHIMSIASHLECRRKGVGEALLIALFDLAVQHRARILTLEVRVSNEVAQNLYLKFGFQKMGLRKAYYLDNREDALIMSTDYIGSPESRERLRQLREAHERKWGRTRFELEKQNVKMG